MTQQTKIYVGGAFDLFHNGHVRLLEKAKLIADYVIVAVNGDSFIETYKQVIPVYNEYERLEIVSSCRFVDHAFIMKRWDDQIKHISILKPNFILHGDDWKGDSLIKQLGLTKEFLEENRIELRYVPYTKSISTTEIKNKIKLQ